MPQDKKNKNVKDLLYRGKLPKGPKKVPNPRYEGPKEGPKIVKPLGKYDVSEHLKRYRSQGYSHSTAQYLANRIKKSDYRNIPKDQKFRAAVKGMRGSQPGSQPGLTPLEKQNMRQEEANHVAETKATAKKAGMAWYRAGIIAITEDLGLKFNPFDKEE